MQAGLLRMAQGKGDREAALAPGRPGLRRGETGYTVDALGRPDGIDARSWFVRSIESPATGSGAAATRWPGQGARTAPPRF